MFVELAGGEHEHGGRRVRHAVGVDVEALREPLAATCIEGHPHCRARVGGAAGFRHDVEGRDGEQWHPERLGDATGGRDTDTKPGESTGSGADHDGRDGRARRIAEQLVERDEDSLRTAFDARASIVGDGVAEQGDERGRRGSVDAGDGHGRDSTPVRCRERREPPAATPEAAPGAGRPSFDPRAP